MDGTGSFGSKKVSSASCLTKKQRDGTTTYYQQVLGASLVHPDHQVVIPLAPEMIIPQDGSTKNDCERNAARRFVANFRGDYPWPGNVRELRNCLERAAIIVPNGSLIRSQHLSIATPALQTAISPAATADHLPDDNEFGYRFSFSCDTISLDAITRRVLDLTLEQCGGNKTKAAQVLKVGRNMFYPQAPKDDASG